MENITCGLTQEKLDAHPTWITAEGRCVALKPDGTQCNCPYSAHLSTPAPTSGHQLQGTPLNDSAKGRYLFHVLKFCSLHYFACIHFIITLFNFIPSVNVNYICFFTALFDFFTRTPTPTCFGTLYTLPAGLQFLFESTRPEIMVIRTCYARILSIVCEQFSIDSETPGKVAGVLFTGAQGNSKVNTYYVLHNTYSYSYNSLVALIV